MKKINFLAKLQKENKIKEIKPSEELKTAYLQRSNESLLSAKTLFKSGSLRDSVALSYYSMYHSLLALLFRIGLKSENHTASIILLKEVFELNNESILKAKKERLDKQYYISFDVQKDEALEAVKTAEEFIGTITDFTDKLTEEKIEELHKKAIELIK